MRLAHKTKKILLVMIVTIVTFGAVNLAPVHAQEQPGLFQRGLGFVGIDTDALSQKLTDTVSKKISSTIAEAIDSVNGIIASIFSWIIKGIGSLLSLLIRTASSLFAYNNYGDAAAVNIGWTLVRDVGNIFFLLVLLVVAIATILRIESYNLRKLLPKILIMAVLVNFSKTIAELFIDFSQIIMLQFVNAFHATFEGQFYNLLGINDLLNAAEQNPSTIGQAGIDLVNILTSYMLATILLFSILVAVLILMGILVVRMVALWMLTLFSPVAYLAAAFPRTEQYAKQWWQEFVKYLVIGPFLAFWIWLALAVGTVSITDDVSTAVQPTTTEQSAQDGATAADLGVEVEPLEVDAFVQRAGGADVFVRLVVMLVMLFVGMKMTLSVGGAIGSVAGTGLGAVKGFSKWYGRRLDDNAFSFAMKKATAGKYGAGAGAQKLGNLLAGNRVTGRLGKRMQGFGGDMKKFGAKMNFRTLPAALKARQARVEQEALGQSQEAATDFFNRQIGFKASIFGKSFLPGDAQVGRRTNSMEMEKARTEAETKQMKQFAVDLPTSEQQISKFKENIDPETGKLLKDEGSKTDGLAAFYAALRDNNFNDLNLDYLKSKDSNGQTYGDKVNEYAKDRWPGFSLSSYQARAVKEHLSEDEFNRLSEDKQGKYKKNEKTGMYERDTYVQEDDWALMDDDTRAKYTVKKNDQGEDDIQTFYDDSKANRTAMVAYMVDDKSDEARILAQAQNHSMSTKTQTHMFGSVKVNDDGTLEAPDLSDVGAEVGVTAFAFSLEEPQAFARTARAEQFLSQTEMPDGTRGYNGWQRYMLNNRNMAMLVDVMTSQPDRFFKKGKEDFIGQEQKLRLQLADAVAQGKVDEEIYNNFNLGMKRIKANDKKEELSDDEKVQAASALQTARASVGRRKKVASSNQIDPVPADFQSPSAEPPKKSRLSGVKRSSDLDKAQDALRDNSGIGKGEDLKKATNAQAGGAIQGDVLRIVLKNELVDRSQQAINATIQNIDNNRPEQASADAQSFLTELAQLRDVLGAMNKIGDQDKVIKVITQLRKSANSDGSYDLEKVKSVMNEQQQVLKDIKNA